MLFEQIAYMENLPFELSFLNVGEESRHCHKEVELLLVLRGVTHYRIYHMDYELNPGDLIIADAEDLHQIHDSSEDILLLSVHVDTGRFDLLYPNIRYMFFVCEECMEGPAGNRQLLQSKLAILKQQLAKLAIDYTRAKLDVPLLTREISDVVSTMVTHFQGFYMEDYQYKTSPQDLRPEDLQRLCRVTRYIMLHYREKIALDDIAAMEHLSPYYMSHLIREHLGFNFQNFVNAIRLEFAEKQLVFTNKTLTQISQDCGFSSPNYFNKCFSAWHGETPSQYRKNYVPCERSYKTPFTKEDALSLLEPYLYVSGAEKKRPHSLTVETGFEADGFLSFQEVFAPIVVIDSAESALSLGFCQKKLQQIRPASFLLTESFTRKNRALAAAVTQRLTAMGFSIACEQKNLEVCSIPKSYPAAIFQQILEEKHRCFLLWGKESSLFLAGDFPSPICDFYSFFRELEDPLVQVNKNYILIKSPSDRLLIFYNPDPDTSLHIHLPAGILPEHTALFQWEFSSREDVLSTLRQTVPADRISSFLSQKIKQQGTGPMRVSLPNKKHAPVADFSIPPGTVVVFDILI